jgi:Flp pilus assembly pilin Flp
MLRLLVRLLRNEDGYTAVECGILACLTAILAEKLVS